MQHLPLILLSLTLPFALTACAGSDGTDGTQGPQGEPGQAVQVEDLDAIAQMLAEDPEFRSKLIQLLVEGHGTELKGEKGDIGECDCETGGNEMERAGRCVIRCEVDEDCANQPRFGCRGGACVDLGCDLVEQCGPDEVWDCLTL